MRAAAFVYYYYYYYIIYYDYDDDDDYYYGEAWQRANSRGLDLGMLDRSTPPSHSLYLRRGVSTYKPATFNAESCKGPRHHSTLASRKCRNFF